MKNLLAILCIFFIGTSASALQVVYPKKTVVTINSPSTFFIGNAKEFLQINDEEIEINKNSGFAKQVKLNFGENKFTLKDNDTVLEYVITRPEPQKNTSCPTELIEYNTAIGAKVIFEGAPLRSTPVDGGINRLSHL